MYSRAINDLLTYLLTYLNNNK